MNLIRRDDGVMCVFDGTGVVPLQDYLDDGKANGSASGIPSIGAAFNFNRTNLSTSRAKLEASRYGGAAMTVGSIGDSTESGGLNATPQAYSTSKLVVDELVRRGYTRNGCGAGVFKNTTDDSRISRVGFTPFGNYTCMARANAPGSTVTFTADVAGTVARCWNYGGNSGGTFTIAIDGGAAEAVTPDGTNTFNLWQKTGLSAALHTIVYTATAGNSSPMFFELLNASGGVREVNLAIGSEAAVDMNNATWYYNTNVAAMLGMDLVIVGLGYNDVSGGSLTALRDVLGTIDRVLAQGKDVIVDLINPSSNYPAVQTFNAAIIPELLKRNLPWVDASSLFTTQAQGYLNGYYIDDVHLRPSGNARKASTIVNALLAI